MNDPISIVFCVNEAYVQHMAVTMASILLHNPEEQFVFHVLHLDISQPAMERVKRMESMYGNHRIEFHKLDRSRLDGVEVPKTMDHLTKEAYLRYFVPEVLTDETRAIYSDVDVICIGKLRPLWEIDIGGVPVAAVSEAENSASRRTHLGLSAEGYYFCSGLLLMDLAAWKAGRFADKLVQVSREYADRLVYADQDAFNVVFDGKIAPLSPVWSCSDPWSPFRRDVRQWHFKCQTRKPWCNIWKNVTWPVYLMYLLKTPYRGNASRFVWGHIKGFFYFKYTKNRVTRHLVCGIRLWKQKETA